MKVLVIDPTHQKTKRDGGTYEAFLLGGTDSQGAITDQVVATAFLKTQPVLHSQLNAVKVGDSVNLELEKNDKGFWGLKSVTVGDAATSTSSSIAPKTGASHQTTQPFRPQLNDNAIGAQVGNALTNAANLIASGNAKKIGDGTLESVAAHVIEVGERLKKRLLSGEFETKTVTVTTKPKEVSKITADSEEIDFD